MHRVRLELDRARDRQHAYLRVQDVLNSVPESPERHEAWRLANDRLGLTVQLRAAGGGTMAGRAVSPKLLEASDRLELQRARRRAARIRSSGAILAELGPEHFDDPLNRRAVPVLDRRRGRRRRADAAARRARRACRARGDRRADGRAAAAASARAEAPARARGSRRTSGFPTCSRRSPRCATGSENSPKRWLQCAAGRAPFPGSSIGRASGC